MLARPISAALLLAASLGVIACGGPADPDDLPVDADVADDPPGSITTPNPLVSRGRPVTSSEGDASAAGALSSINDGVYQGGDGFQASVQAGQAPWVAIDVGAGPSRLLLTWLSEGTVDTPTRTPVDYQIQVSPDALTWQTVVTVTGNDTNAREHAFDFTGHAWVRVVVDRADSTDTVHFIELEAYDVSHGSEDTWLFLGDSITAMAMNHYVAPDLATLIHQARPDYWPMIIDEAIGGTQTSYALTPGPGGAAPLDTWLARFPDVRNIVVAYGTNDAVCDADGANVGPFIDNLTEIVDRLEAAGKRIVIPHIPWNHWDGCEPTFLDPYNAAIDQLYATRDVVPGPDLHAYFAAHQDQLADGVHPDSAGVAAMNRLWSEALIPLHVR